MKIATKLHFTNSDQCLIFLPQRFYFRFPRPQLTWSHFTRYIITRRRRPIYKWYTAITTLTTKQPQNSHLRCSAQFNSVRQD